MQIIVELDKPYNWVAQIEHAKLQCACVCMRLIDLISELSLLTGQMFPFSGQALEANLTEIVN